MEPKDADKRTWQRYATLGKLDEKAYERHLKSLPDLAEKAVSVDTVMFENEVDDDEDEKD
ncbi:MAG TPA: hypothetical protein VH208_05385 [Myxococcaceae bacterium]|nr:hypothetical protein [Myxococcaceae bacterium]